MNTRILDWKTMVGKRILCGSKDTQIREAIVEEVSESGNYIRLSSVMMPVSSSRQTYWHARQDIPLLEVLPNLPRFIEKSEQTIEEVRQAHDRIISQGQQNMYKTTSATSEGR